MAPGQVAGAAACVCPLIGGALFTGRRTVYWAAQGMRLALMDREEKMRSRSRIGRSSIVKLIALLLPFVRRRRDGNQWLPVLSWRTFSARFFDRHFRLSLQPFPSVFLFCFEESAR
jgi:hypothetical protein